MAQFDILKVDFNADNKLFIEIDNPDQLTMGTQELVCPDDVVVVHEGEPVPPNGLWVPEYGDCYTVELTEPASEDNPNPLRYETEFSKPTGDEGEERVVLHLIVYSKNGKGKTRKVRRIAAILIKH